MFSSLNKFGRMGASAQVTFDPTKVRAPVFSPSAGEYGPTTAVSISSATVGDSIRYTTDGSTPTNAVGTVYTVPVSIAATTSPGRTKRA